MSAIQYYEDGKAISGDAPQTKASGITFDNTNSDLVSEDVESAIKEVNNRTKHGIVELWANPSPDSSFAGQTVNVTIDKVIDTILFEFGEASSNPCTLRLSSCEVGARAEENLTVLQANGKVARYMRQISVSQSESTVSIIISDCTRGICNTYGSALTTDTANSVLVPFRIFGIMHED